MINKERVLVRDNKGVFLKMFKRKFKKEFEFSEDSFLLKKENKSDEFDHSVFVVYEYTELLQFFELDFINTNFILCLFSKNLYNTLSMIEGIKGLIMIDGSKTKLEIFEDLNFYFHQSSGLMSDIASYKTEKFKLKKKQLEVIQRAIYYMK